MAESSRRVVWLLILQLALWPVTSECDSAVRGPREPAAVSIGRAAKDESLQEQPGDDGATASDDQNPGDAEEDSDDFIPGMKSPPVRLGTIPQIALASSSQASPEEVEEIKQLIRQLAAIENPDFGLSGTMSGRAFLPIEGASQAGAMLLTNHQLESSPDLRRLIELGPKALPFLLAALDDETPTKLVMQHEGMMGVMAYANELWGNPINPTEQRILGPTRRHRGMRGQRTDEHTVTIGDVSLVAIGQIVGRPYQAVRYQPTACIMLNSPTHDAELCRQVREIWSSTDAAQTLLDSLLLDYATEGIANGTSLDGWDIGSELQIAAAMRLLYYFPAESVDLIAERLDKLDVSATGPGNGSMLTSEELDSYMNQCVANGVRADAFIEATAWCREPKVRAAMLRIFERATDPDVVVASMRALGPGDEDKMHAKISPMIDDLADESEGPFGDGYNLLVALGKCGDVDAKPIFQKYLDVGSLVHCRSMCQVLREVHPEWAAELLEPLLADQRPSDGWTYPVMPNQNEPRLPIRVCDEAAETLAAADASLRFEMHGTHEDLDRQIQVMQAALQDR